MSNLIEQINVRAHDPEKATDADQRVAAPPATEEQIASAERALGFTLPPLLRELYLNVGNGGFGPGDGLYGVPTSEEDARENIVGKYRELKDRAKASWPERLLIICTWGCGIDSSLDCSKGQSSMVVVRHDPNMAKRDVATRVPASMHYARAAEVDGACWAEWESFEAWLQAWVDGQNLFYLAYGEKGVDDFDEDYDDEEDGEDGGE